MHSYFNHATTEEEKKCGSYFVLLQTRFAVLFSDDCTPVHLLILTLNRSLADREIGSNTYANHRLLSPEITRRQG